MNRFWGILLLAVVWALPALAHTKSQSFSSWSLQGADIVMVFQVDARRVTLLRVLDETPRTPDDQLALHLLETITVSQDGAACTLDGAPRRLRAAEGYQRQELRFRCADPGTWQGVTATVEAFFPVSAQHIHFARARGAGGGWRELIYSDTARRHSLANVDAAQSHAPQGPPFLVYTWLGVQHILEGLDHLAFVAALLLLSQNLRQVLFLITGFTVGHSITLALAALGVISPNVPVIEALIGFTIAFVAAEVLAAGHLSFWPVARIASAALVGLACVTFLWGGALSAVVWGGLILFVLAYGRMASEPGQHAWIAPVLTLSFGLVHGAGFANVLAEIGLPPDRFVWALLGFNVGVEIGQILVVGLLGALWFVAAKLLSRDGLALLAHSSATVLLALGVFWFVDRAF